MKRLRLMQLKKIEKILQDHTIRNKIRFYMCTVFLCIFVSVLFNIWVAYFSLGTFDNILSESSKTSAFVQAMENESKLFEQFMKSRTTENEQLLDFAMKETQKAIEALPFNYRMIGEKRYSLTWSIRNCYEVYVEKRDSIFEISQGTLQYVNQLYEIYDIHDNQYCLQPAYHS